MDCHCDSPSVHRIILCDHTPLLPVCVPYGDIDKTLSNVYSSRFRHSPVSELCFMSFRIEIISCLRLSGFSTMMFLPWWMQVPQKVSGQHQGVRGKLREVKGQMLLWICPFPIPFVLLAITSNDRRE